MTSDELIELLNKIQKTKCETQTLELKSAKNGYPKRLYDSLSSFSNQENGGVIVLGVDEKMIMTKLEYMILRIYKKDKWTMFTNGACS